MCLVCTKRMAFLLPISDCEYSMSDQRNANTADFTCTCAVTIGVSRCIKMMLLLAQPIYRTSTTNKYAFTIITGFKLTALIVGMYTLHSRIGKPPMTCPTCPSLISLLAVTFTTSTSHPSAPLNRKLVSLLCRRSEAPSLVFVRVIL